MSLFSSSSKVIEWAAATVKHGVFLTYEQVLLETLFWIVLAYKQYIM